MTSSSNRNTKGTSPKIEEIDKQIVRLLGQRATEVQRWLSDATQTGSPWPEVWTQQQAAAMAVENEDSVAPLHRGFAIDLMKHIASATFHSVAIRKRVAYLGTHL